MKKYIYEVKIYVKNKKKCIAKANVSSSVDLQELYDSLKSDSSVFNFGDTWIMKSEICHVTIKER